MGDDSDRWSPERVCTDVVVLRQEVADDGTDKPQTLGRHSRRSYRETWSLPILL